MFSYPNLPSMHPTLDLNVLNASSNAKINKSKLSITSTYLTIDLPQYRYKKMRFVKIPFNPYESNNSQFQNLDDAMVFVGKHCIKNHGFFKYGLAKSYIDHCAIFNVLSGKYEQLFDVDESILRKSFNKAQQVIYCSI